MINILVTIIVGAIVGVLARFFYPGPVPMSMLWTIILGIAGSFLAGFVVHRGQPGMHRAGIIASIIGGMVLIFVGSLLHLGS